MKNIKEKFKVIVNPFTRMVTVVEHGNMAQFFVNEIDEHVHFELNSRLYNFHFFYEECENTGFAPSIYAVENGVTNWDNNYRLSVMIDMNDSKVTALEKRIERQASTMRLVYETKPLTAMFRLGQKTISATVSRNHNAYAEFEQAVRKRFPRHEFSFNHVGKQVVLIS